MRLTRRSALLSLGALGTACKRDGAGLLVFAAASTSESLSELGRSFEQKHGEHVRFSWGASGDLARQIEAGAPADMFLSADRAKVDRLESAGHIAARTDLLRNRLVVVVSGSSGSALGSPRDLVGLKRIAVGDPITVPAGAYAREWLERAGVWSQLTIVPTLDVRAALAAVESGNVDAAIVYRTDARVARSARVAFEPTEQPDIVYPLAITKRARRSSADAFVALAKSAEGRAVFERRGFIAI